jgi:hypothetical protein
MTVSVYRTANRVIPSSRLYPPPEKGLGEEGLLYRQMQYVFLRGLSGVLDLAGDLAAAHD